MKKSLQRGVSLIEIMVTVFIIAIGLLGMAALQFMSLKNANSSHFRYQASLLAYDMAERMRANNDVAEAGSYGGLDVNGTETNCEPSCTELQRDSYQWGQQIKGLPGGRGRVSFGGGNYTISIDWTEQQTGEGLAQSGSSASTKNFSVIYTP